MVLRNCKKPFAEIKKKHLRYPTRLDYVSLKRLLAKLRHKITEKDDFSFEVKNMVEDQIILIQIKKTTSSHER